MLSANERIGAVWPAADLIQVDAVPTLQERDALRCVRARNDGVFAGQRPSV